jgi:hypothetical protein
MSKEGEKEKRIKTEPLGIEVIIRKFSSAVEKRDKETKG